VTTITPTVELKELPSRHAAEAASLRALTDYSSSSKSLRSSGRRCAASSRKVAM